MVRHGTRNVTSGFPGRADPRALVRGGREICCSDCIPRFDTIASESVAGAKGRRVSRYSEGSGFMAVESHQDGRTTQGEAICPYCGVGCRLWMEAASGRLIRIKGVADAPANLGGICTRGRRSARSSRPPTAW